VIEVNAIRQGTPLRLQTNLGLSANTSSSQGVTIQKLLLKIWPSVRKAYDLKQGYPRRINNMFSEKEFFTKMINY
jgi:hypothetical protein